MGTIVDNYWDVSFAIHLALAGENPVPAVVVVVVVLVLW